MNTISDYQIIAVIIAITAAFRSQFPKLDGKLYIFIISIVIAISLMFLSTVNNWRVNIVHGIILGLTASGGMEAINYAGKKINDTNSINAKMEK